VRPHQKLVVLMVSFGLAHCLFHFRNGARLYRRMEKNVQLVDFNCVDFVEKMMYGHYYKDPSK
jgi:hypothetical protein